MKPRLLLSLSESMWPTMVNCQNILFCRSLRLIWKAKCPSTVSITAVGIRGMYSKTTHCGIFFFIFTYSGNMQSNSVGVCIL